PVIEFAEPATMRRFFGELVADAGGRQPVENPELALAQALVDDGARRPAGERALLANERRGLLRADVRRGQDQLGPLALRQGGEPPARRSRLVLAEPG